MKGKLIKLVALFSSLLLMLSLVACGGDSDDKNTTTSATKANAEVSAEADLNGETAEVSGSEAETDKNGEKATDKNKTEKSDKTTKKDSKDKTTTGKNNKEKTTKKSNKNNSNKTPTATTKKKSDQAPVDGSIAEIVKFYNTAANATKAKQNFTYTRKEITKVTIDDISSDSKLLENLSDQIISEGNKIIASVVGNGDVVKQTFVNGKPDKVFLNGEEVTKKKDLEKMKIAKNNCMPIMGSEKMSTLTADGVKSATCKKDGDGYVVTIVLKPEKGTLTQKPKYHASCVNYLRLEALDLGILNDNIKSAEMNYVDSTDSGTKFVARINKNNLLDYMNTDMSINGSGIGKMFGITATAKLHGTYESEYNYIW